MLRRARRNTHRWRLAALPLLGALLSCGEAAPGPLSPPPPPGTLTLPVRVHVLSSRVDLLDCDLSDGEVSSLLARVNEIWAEADIVWELESIHREAALSEAEIQRAISEGTPLGFELVANVIPRDRLTDGSWDVFLVRDLADGGVAPGFYFAEIPAAVSSELDPVGLDDPGRIFAHELGHSLTLRHSRCTTEGNLMAPACGGSDPTRLTPAQIENARIQAAKGRPFAY